MPRLTLTAVRYILHDMKTKQITIRLSEEEYVMFETARLGMGAVAGEKLTHSGFIMRMCDDVIADNLDSFGELGITGNVVRAMNGMV